jgi:hypothetical protein
MKLFLAKLGAFIHWFGFSVSLLIAFTLATSSTDTNNPIITFVLATVFCLIPIVVTWGIRFMLSGNRSIFPWSKKLSPGRVASAETTIDKVFANSQEEQALENTEELNPREQNFWENVHSPEKHQIWLKENWEIDYYGKKLWKDDYLVMRAISRDLAEISIRNGEFDKAWGLLEEEQTACLNHANKSDWNAEQAFALISPIAIKRANLLRIEGNYIEALNHIIYGHLIGGKRTTTLKKVQTYFKRCNFESATFNELTEFIDNHDHAVDLREIQLFVNEL